MKHESDDSMLCEGQLYYYENGMAKYNILNELENSGNKNSSKSINLNLNARWRVYEDLTISATLGGASSSSFAETWFSERSHKITAIRGYEYGEFTVTDNEYKKSKLPYGGMLTVSESRNFNYTARIQAEFVKLCNGVHAVNLVAGFETRSNQYNGFFTNKLGIYARPRKELYQCTVELWDHLGRKYGICPDDTVGYRSLVQLYFLLYVRWVYV